MKKIITTALVAATAVVALSACSSVENGSNTAGKTHQAATTGNKTKAPATIAKKTKAPAAPKYTVAQQNAIESAQSYLDMSGFSRAGLIQQLSSKAGEGFKMADAVFAVNHVKVDWNKEAVESAKSYLQIGGFSRASLIQQLSSNAGEQFTLAQATYAANHVGL
ncbi:MAG: Ltp family lipoprotein [Jatrophihabitantaceae bacterium]